MKLPNSYSFLIKDLLTAQDKKILSERLDTFSNISFQVGRDPEDALHATFSYNQAQALATCLADCGCDFKNPQQMVTALARIKAAVQLIPELTIHTAIGLRRDFLLTLSEQVSHVVGEKIVFHLLVEQGIVAGAIFEFNGRYFDGSVGKKLSEISNW